MKIKIILVTFILIIFGGCSSNTLTIEYNFIGIEEGFDHQTKSIVYVNDEKIAESNVELESEGNAIEIALEPGMYTIKLVNYALYEGNWEEHITENGYSIDCVFEDVVNTQFTKVIKILFDLDKGMSFEKDK